MKVISPAFGNNQPIRADFTADGANISPPLHIEQLPPGTQELAVICDDPDAPRAEPFVHWVLYKLPPTTTDLPAGIRPARKLNNPPGAEQGWNDMKTIGYTGPAPPPGHGVHHYHFRVYALDKPLELEPALDEKSVISSMSGHILDTAEVVGIYQRP